MSKISVLGLGAMGSRMTEACRSFPASQITDILQVRKAFFGALLVHSSLQMG